MQALWGTPGRARYSGCALTPYGAAVVPPNFSPAYDPPNQPIRHLSNALETQFMQTLSEPHEPARYSGCGLTPYGAAVIPPAFSTAWNPPHQPLGHLSKT